jgi:hypothetical protein
MVEPVYVPYEQYRAAKTRCGLDSRIYCIYNEFLHVINFITVPCISAFLLRTNLCINFICSVLPQAEGTRSSIAVKALCCKPEGRGFETR